MEEAPSVSSNVFEAEQVLLGSLLIDPELLDEVAEQVNEEDFSDTGHAVIYRAITALYSKFRTAQDWQERINIVSVSSFVAKSKSKPGGIGPSGNYYDGTPYIMDLINVQMYASLPGAIAQIKTTSAVKRAQQLALEIVKIATSASPTDTAGEIDDKVATVVSDYTARVSVPSVTMKSMTEHVAELKRQAEDMSERRSKGEIVDVYTGIPLMDSNIIGGLIKSDLMFIAAEPGGKKSLTLQYILDHNANIGHGVVMMSTEMLGTQLAARRIAPEAGVQSRAIRSGIMDGDEWMRFEYSAKVAECDWFLVDDMTYDARRMVTAIKRAERTLRDMGHPLRLIGIDYLQMLSEGGGEYSADRRIEIDRILRALRHVANTVAPVIILSQFNLTGKPGERPHSRQMAETSGSWKIASFAVVLWNEKGVHKFGFDKARDGVAPFDGDMPMALAHHAWYAEKAVSPPQKPNMGKPKDAVEIAPF